MWDTYRDIWEHSHKYTFLSIWDHSHKFIFLRYLGTLTQIYIWDIWEHTYKHRQTTYGKEFHFIIWMHFNFSGFSCIQRQFEQISKTDNSVTEWCQCSQAEVSRAGTSVAWWEKLCEMYWYDEKNYNQNQSVKTYILTNSESLQSCVQSKQELFVQFRQIT